MRGSQCEHSPVGADVDNNIAPSECRADEHLNIQVIPSAKKKSGSVRPFGNVQWHIEAVYFSTHDLRRRPRPQPISMVTADQSLIYAPPSWQLTGHIGADNCNDQFLQCSFQQGRSFKLFRMANRYHLLVWSTRQPDKVFVCFGWRSAVSIAYLCQPACRPDAIDLGRKFVDSIFTGQ